jgi:8-oxo-dGTP diphosphatase
VSEFQIQLHVGAGGVATVEWSGEVSPEALERAVGMAADDAILGQGLRRLEVALPVEDRVARRAVLRAGFRLEGVRREAEEQPDGSLVDIALFGRLASDTVHGPTGFSAVMNTALPRKRLIAHVLIRDEIGRVLLCETQFKADWELPGGIVEPYEAPRLGAAREVVEELGVERPIGRLMVADWMPPYLGWDDAVELLFDGGTIDDTELADLVLQPSEIAQVRLCTLAEAEDVLTPLAHRRLSVALGLGPDEFAYLEDGTRPA